MTRALFTAAVVALLLCAALAAPAVKRYGSVIVADESDQTAQCINDYLCIGNQFAACNRDDMQEQGITHVVSLIGSLQCAPVDVPRTIVDVADVASQDMGEAFARAAEMIDEVRQQGGRVLVHCAAGVSRSSATIIYYLMTRTGVDYDDALQQVRTARSVVRPNSGFEQQLRALHKSEL